ncbi:MULTISPECIES: Lrp/AsnC family transcriptional regulator [Saccharopolyspora]|uniref:Lrp/AsnC family transcriptional regulator n=2 Tax=Saccharopolyspora TaxID=1835 RepID=A0A4V2YVR9_9PSEU|nr:MULTISPECIES: Lrp/AsnC family transcriptional regulator [Saccharopolyspora]MBQ0924918.1 Lrp/AsnC family transcriptional regulator [Saccharopolyspora endophytica]TDD82557.1 Lrp/AsnC family transcriptional regulator [Saccharopolyspora karakumensis]
MSPFEPLDMAVLRLIADEPRAGVREYARRLGVARATVQSRVDKLQRLGVLISWQPQFDPAAMGYQGLAYVRLNLAQGKLDHALDGLSRIPEVVEANAVAGDADLLCRVVAKDNAGLEEVLQQIIAVDGVERISTEVVLSRRIKPRISPLIRKLHDELGR